MAYWGTNTDKIHLFFLLDRSGSMTGTRINNLNDVMTNLLYELTHLGQQWEKYVLMHILAFDHDIQWLCGTTAEVGVPVQDIQWTDIAPGTGTNTAAAIRAIMPGLSTRYLGSAAYRPVIVLITDGGSDNPWDTKAAVKEIIAHQKTSRVGIGVQDYNAEELNTFASPAFYRMEDELGNLSEAERRPLVYTVYDATDLTELLSYCSLTRLWDSEDDDPENDEVVHVIKTAKSENNREVDWLDWDPGPDCFGSEDELRRFENEAEQSERTHNEEQEEDSIFDHIFLDPGPDVFDDEDELRRFENEAEQSESTHNEEQEEYLISDEIHIFFLLDRSGSMTGTRINTLNEAMTNMLYKLSDFQFLFGDGVLMHILAFDHDIQWLCGTTAEVGVPVGGIQWTDITPGSGTDTAAAIRAITPGLSAKYLGTTTYRPVIVLITDGVCDDAADMQAAVQEIIDYQKTLRVGIGVEDYNAAELNAFASPADYYKKDELGNLSEVERLPLVYTVSDATDLMELLENGAASVLKTSSHNILDPENDEVIHVIKTAKRENNSKSAKRTNEKPEEDSDSSDSEDGLWL